MVPPTASLGCEGAIMAVEINGIAHVQLTVSDPERCVPFWEKLCHFLSMETLVRGEDIVYCIGGRTGILVRGAPREKRGVRFDQDHADLPPPSTSPPNPPPHHPL